MVTVEYQKLLSDVEAERDTYKVVCWFIFT